MSAREKTISELIAMKRAEGYDAEFEANLAQIWECPHCWRRCTILELVIPIGNPEMSELCPRCGCEGIEPIDTDQPNLFAINGGKS